MKILAVTSGKGGVGKTNISANLGIALAAQGQRVVVLDADIGLANLDVVLGCKAAHTLQDVLRGHKTLSQVIQEGPGDVRFIAGGSGLEEIFLLNGDQGAYLVSELTALAATTDFLIFDTGAGLDANVLTFLGAASEVLIVVTPDPASLTDGYATAKAILSSTPEAQIGLVINQVSGANEADGIFNHLNDVAKRFLKRELKLIGYVRMDLEAVGYIRRRIPFVIGNPKLPASTDIRRIAAEMLGRRSTGASLDLRSRLRALFPFAAQKIA